jgi:hypothetical protein
MGYTPPNPIDVGSAAINRGSAKSTRTCIGKDNPANASGKITSVEIWAQANLSNVEVATFFVVSGNNLSTRDTHVIGSVTAGSKQTFSGLDIDVEAGDYIGIYFSGGFIENDISGHSGVWSDNGGDFIPCTDHTFSVLHGNAISLYGTGGSGSGELTIGEAFSTVDSWARRIHLTEAFSIADSLVKNVTKQLSEAFSAVDSKVTKISKALAEALSIADSLVKNGTEQLAEALSIADSMSTAATKALAEAVSVADALTTGTKVAFTETLSVVVYNWRKLRCAVLAWAKKDDPTTVWTKKDDPTTGWERKD